MNKKNSTDTKQKLRSKENNTDTKQKYNYFNKTNNITYTKRKMSKEFNQKIKMDKML